MGAARQQRRQHRAKGEMRVRGVRAQQPFGPATLCPHSSLSLIFPQVASVLDRFAHCCVPGPVSKEAPSTSSPATATSTAALTAAAAGAGAARYITSIIASFIAERVTMYVRLVRCSLRQ